jgi:hypothetical protein
LLKFAIQKLSAPARLPSPHFLTGCCQSRPAAIATLVNGIALRSLGAAILLRLGHDLDFRHGSLKHGLLKHGRRTASTTNLLGSCKHRQLAIVTAAVVEVETGFGQRRQEQSRSGNELPSNLAD